MSYEGLRYWQNWGDHLNAVPNDDLAKFHQCGMATLKTEGGHHLKVLAHFDAIGIPYEHWDIDDFRVHLPELDLSTFGPPKRPDDESFWNDPTEQLEGAVFTPEAGYISDPQLAAQNLFTAATALGCEFLFKAEVMSITRNGDRIAGLQLADGRTISTPVVVNAAGPHSRMINEMAGALEDMSIGTRPLRQEVHHVSSPPNLISSIEALACRR